MKIVHNGPVAALQRNRYISRIAPDAQVAIMKFEGWHLRAKDAIFI